MLTLLSSSYHLPPATVERQGRKGAKIIFSPLIFPWSLSQPGTENAVTRSAVRKILKQCTNESFEKFRESYLRQREQRKMLTTQLEGKAWPSLKAQRLKPLRFCKVYHLCIWKVSSADHQSHQSRKCQSKTRLSGRGELKLVNKRQQEYGQLKVIYNRISKRCKCLILLQFDRTLTIKVLGSFFKKREKERKAIWRYVTFNNGNNYVELGLHTWAHLCHKITTIFKCCYSRNFFYLD